MMLDFSTWLDLPLIWGMLLATAIFLYVVLDGFDLGCGILFPWAPTDDCRSRMMNSIAPFWDGNETWLVLGGAGLFVAFPVAYAVLMPAFYLPVMLMLMGLIFRGVAFEFRFKAQGRDRKLWDRAFHVGSWVAAFAQGVILGHFIQGVQVHGRVFSGASMDGLNGFSLLTGVALVMGYALLGATWLVMKTDGETQAWARRVGRRLIVAVTLIAIPVMFLTPHVAHHVWQQWSQLQHAYALISIAFLVSGVAVLLWRDLHRSQRETRPFMLTLLLFLCSYVALGVSLFPWVVPYAFTLWDAAAVPASQSLTLIGAVIMLPIILAYTAYCYYVFRGKSCHEPMY